MKICWDSLEKLAYRRGNLYDKFSNKLFYKICISCGEDFIGRKDARFCDNHCMINEFNPMSGRKHNKRSIQKIINARQTQIITEKTKQKLSNMFSGKGNPFYGKHHTQDIKQRLRDNKIGTKLTNEHKNNISNGLKANPPMLGKNHTEETKRLMSLKAKVRFSDPKNNPMYGRNGPLSPGWKGGIACEPYCQQWTDKEYKNWLKYERDGGECQNPQCNGKSNKICLHHINYIKKDCRPVNLITLCNSCNIKANNDREWHTAYYTEIIRRNNEK